VKRFVYTLASDMFPRSAVGSVVGIGAFAGAMGGVLFQRAVGRILDAQFFVIVLPKLAPRTKAYADAAD